MKFLPVPSLLPFHIMNNPSIQGSVSLKELLIVTFLVIGVPFGILILASLVYKEKGD